MNRIIKLFLVLSLFLNFTAFANEVTEYMQKGNEFYVKGNFEEAIKIYESLVEKGYEGTSLFYNLGNAYYRTGKIGYAILYYEKALNLSPEDEDIIQNLQIAQLNIKDKIEPIPSFFLFKIWQAILAFFSINGWAIISYILLLFVLFSLGYYFFTRDITQQRISFYSFVILLIAFIISVSLLVVKFNQQEKLKYGIVIENTLTARTSPDPQGKEAFIIHEGLKVQVEDRVDKWIKIRLADGQVGWVDNNSIGII